MRNRNPIVTPDRYFVTRDHGLLKNFPRRLERKLFGGWHTFAVQ
jgi:hypothetical protein